MMKNLYTKISAILYTLFCLIFSSCSFTDTNVKEEQISITDDVLTNDSTSSLEGTTSLKQLPTYPNSVILTGLPEHRLVTVYRKKVEETTSSGSFKISRDYYGGGNETVEHYMPGIDILYGYNLLNIAHYDLKIEKLNFLVSGPGLVKTVYYPSFVQDSLDKKPINRNYYLMSVYDADTNNDTLINSKDLRKFYHFDASATTKTQLIPNDYSVERSQYDSKNDIMYIFARHDDDANGSVDLKKEPLHIFWIRLKDPQKATRLY